MMSTKHERVESRRRTALAAALAFVAGLVFVTMAGAARGEVITIRINTSTGSACVATPDGTISSKYCEDGISDNQPPAWHAAGDPNSAVDDELVFSNGGTCAFDVGSRVSDPNGSSVSVVVQADAWPSGCSYSEATELVTGTVSGGADTGSVTMRATDPASAHTDQIFSWEVISPSDTTPPTTPGTPTLIERLEFSSEITWTASTDTETGLKHYEVYKCGPSPCTPATLAQTSLTNTATVSVNSASSTPSYAIKAVDNSDNVSALSGVLAAGIYDPEDPPPVGDADYTVCDAGCSHTPAQIVALVGTTVAGDVVELRSTPQGSTDTWTASIDLDGETGAANNEIIWRVRAGDTIIVDNGGTGLSLIGSSYVVIDGTAANSLGLRFGDVTDWAQANGGRGYNQDQALFSSNSRFIQIKNLTFYGGSTYACSEVHRSSDHFLLDNVNIEYCGTNSDPGGSGDGDRGDAFIFQAANSIIKNSSCTHGGHNCISAIGPYQVYRNNFFDGNWADEATGFPGARPFVILSGFRSKWRPSNAQIGKYGMILLEDTILQRGGQGEGGNINPSMKAQGFGLILRDNFFWDQNGMILQGPSYDAIAAGDGQGQGRFMFYNNTAYNVTGLLYINDNEFTAAWEEDEHQENHSRNNLLVNVTDGGRDLIEFKGDDAAAAGFLNGYPNSWKGSTFMHDVYSGTTSILRADLDGVGDAVVAITNCTQWPNNVCNNVIATPTFTTNPAGVSAGNRTKSQFTLSPSSSVGIGDAVHLTTATSTGTNDTTLTLANAYYFYAGADPATWDMSYFGESGDDICVGATTGTTAVNAQATRIQSINYATGAIVVSPGVNTVNGSKVWKREQDSASCASGVWDNKGAQQ